MPAQALGSLMLSYWRELALFASVVLLVALYGLSASGHFPAEYRSAKLRAGAGAALLWGSMAVAGLAAAFALVRGFGSLPWYAAVIASGAVLLFAPLLLQRLPDSFVNGRRSLVTFSAGAALFAVGLWAAS